MCSHFLAVTAVAVIMITSGPAFCQAPVPTTPAPRTATSIVDPHPSAGSTMNTPDGMRLSRLIGAVVYDDRGGKIGSVDDLVVRLDNKVSVAILSVGGFLGVDTKLVSVPYNEIRIDGGKVVLPAASKETLSVLPAFSYAP
jgi:sporulation protein YlmC with PRC-barrel domain